jgi:hypothetical protein
MVPKCLLLLLWSLMTAAATAAGRTVYTAEPGNWTVENCIVVKMSSQVGRLLPSCKFLIF